MSPTFTERFFSRTDVTVDGCWTWTGSIAGNGYGGIRVAGVWTRAHRVAYEMFVGPIPPGLVIDHLCRNRRCVRPDHLEPVTFRENILRGSAPSAVHARKTECPRGHPYAGDNLRVVKGRRACVACQAIRNAARSSKTSALGVGVVDKRVGVHRHASTEPHHGVTATTGSSHPDPLYP